MKKFKVVLSMLSMFLIGLGLNAQAATSASTTNNTAFNNTLPPQPLYWELFGGGGSFSADNITQIGTIDYPFLLGGPLDVDATGTGESAGFWMIGINMGYKWPEFSSKDSTWAYVPSAEVEGYYWQGTQNGTLTNQISAEDSDRVFVDNATANQFSASYPMHTGVFLLNGVLTAHQQDAHFRPYVGLGIGAAIISVQGATAAQTDPSVAGVNLYNSTTDATDWAFATQAKIGLNYMLSEKTSIFAEYRFLYLTSTSYVLGPTDSDDYPSTTDWNINLGCMAFNMGTIGIRYDA